MEANNYVLVATSASAVAKDSLVIHGSELQNIKEQLVRFSDQRRIVPVSGMGGIGKTTLARAVYRDPIVRSHFDTRAWVTVSQQHHTHRLLREILSCVPVEESSENDKIEDKNLAEILRKRLKCRRYLVVVDDVWTTDAWDELRLVFPDEENGSRIIVTTRENKVAKYVQQGGSRVNMSLLTSDESQKLLISKAFGQQSCPYELEEIASIIASRCQGLPLTINVIGRVLAERKTKDHWNKVAEDMSLSMGKEKSKQLLDLLALSYNCLPHRLKPCFLYLGIFPEDFEIPVSKLTRMWVSEGFIEATQTSSEHPEETAEEYLEDLISRNLVLRGEMSFDGRMKKCAVHDLLRNVIHREANRDGFFRPERNIHGDVFLPGVRSWKLNPSFDFTSSYFYFGGSYKSSNSWYITNKLQSFSTLTVLHIGTAYHDSVEIPFQTMSQLILLRYLAARFDHKPNLLQKLHRLETLINYNRFETPMWGWEELSKMKQLRHLKCDFCFRKPRILSATTVMPNLQTLGRVSLATCVVISGFPNLRKLHVLESEHDDDQAMTSEQKLANLNCLRSLKTLQTLKCIFWEPMSAPRWDFLPTSLQRLTLGGGWCPWEGMKILGKLPLLQVLKLFSYAFKGLVWELTDEDNECFPQLRFLRIESTDLCYWKATSMSFQKLECLVLIKCSYLEEIPGCFGDLCTLRYIELQGCSLSAVDSAERIKQEKQDMGDDDLVVKTSNNGNSYTSFGRFKHQVRTQLKESQPQLRIIAISGRGGMGKTNLITAPMNYLENTFDFQALITIHEPCHRVHKLTWLRLVQKFPGGAIGSTQEIDDSKLPDKVCSLLRGRRYLIAIDELWSAEMWDDMKRAFPDDNNGSRIIVTTQDTGVADYVRRNSLPIHMKSLGPFESLYLLMRRRRLEAPTERYQVAAEQIVSKCQGLPLSINIIDGVLHHNPHLWNDIAEEIPSLLSKEEPDELLDLLALGYKYLPHHLKLCFLSLGVFRKYSIISASWIIEHWISQELVQQVTTSSKSLEETAREFLQELISRNLVDILQEKFCSDGVVTCSVNYLLHDVLSREAQKQSYKIVHVTHLSPII